MSKFHLSLLSVAVLEVASIRTALAETDRKSVSAIVCQPERPEDRANLKYFARGIQAINKDVLINCPIVRDSTLSALKIFEARYQRGLEPPVPKDLQRKKFSGVLFSCSNVENGNPCVASGEANSSATNDPTSVIFNPVQLPFDEDRHYIFKTTLPKDAILKSLRWTEKVD